MSASGQAKPFPKVEPCIECGSGKLHWHGSYKDESVVVITHNPGCPAERRLHAFVVDGPHLTTWNDNGVKAREAKAQEGQS